MAPELRIDVWDQIRREWRSFVVIPYEPNFKPTCRYPLHQFWPSTDACACRAMTRTVTT